MKLLKSNIGLIFAGLYLVGGLILLYELLTIEANSGWGGIVFGAIVLVYFYPSSFFMFDAPTFSPAPVLFWALINTISLYLFILLIEMIVRNIWKKNK